MFCSKASASHGLVPGAATRSTTTFADTAEASSAERASAATDATSASARNQEVLTAHMVLNLDGPQKPGPTQKRRCAANVAIDRRYVDDGARARGVAHRHLAARWRGCARP